MKRFFKRLGICMLLMTLVVSGVSGLWMPLGTANQAMAAPQTIYNQDGNGFSGTIEGNEVLGTAMTGYRDWPDGFNKTTNASFNGSVYDGTNIWMIPFGADRVIKVNTKTGAMTGYNNWPSGFTKNSSAFAGGVYDGTNVWMIPSSADRVVKINTTTGVMTGYNNWPSGFTKVNSAFAGGVYDGTNIWLIPYTADRIIKINATTGVMTGYNSWPSGFTKSSAAFIGGVYDGTNIWMVPNTADRLIKVNVTTGAMTGYNSWPSGFTKSSSAFAGGVYDGTNIWMIPYNADRLVKVNAATGVMTGYNSWPSGFTKGSAAFWGGGYDGTNIWMAPVAADRVIKVNATTGQMTGYNNWPNGFTKPSNVFWGGVYDGNNMWMTPFGADRLVKIGYSADLRSMTLSEGTLSPVFDPETITYTASADQASVEITAVLADESAALTVNNAAATSGAAVHVPLNVGPNTITIVVTARDEQTKTYTVTVTRALPPKSDVTNTAGTAAVMYMGTTIDLASLSTLFTVDTNAGARTYTVEPGGTGEGTINGSILTVEKAGPIQIGLATSETETHYAGVKQIATLTVNKGNQSAPSGLSKTSVTTHGGSDGTITGLTAGTSYEYKQEGSSSYTPVTAGPSGEITGLAAGSYVVRLAATELYNAGADSAAVIVGQPENTPTAVIDYGAEQLTGLTAGSGYTVNGEAVTADGDGKLTIDSNWLGITLSIVKPGNGTTTEDSAAQQLDVPSRGTAPNTVGKTDETALHAANGTLTGLSIGMEYKKGAAGAWLDVGGSSVTGLAPDTYYVRVKATATAFASAEQSVTVNAYTLVKEITPEAGIDYSAEQLTGLTAGAGYTVNGEAVTVDVDGKLAIDSSWLGTTLSIVKTGNGTTTEDSAAQQLDVPSRGTAPNTVGKTDETALHAANGTLTGLSIGMEYKKGAAGAWLDVGGSSVTGLAPDTYYVRVKATATAFASAEQSVTVNAYTLVKELTPAAGIDYSAEQLTGLTAGAGYTVSGEAVTADGDGKLAIDSSWLGTTLSIVKPGNGSTTEDSAAQLLDVPARGTAPNNVGKTDETALHATNGTLTGLSIGMEYKKGAAGAWLDVGGSSVTGLAPDTYYVRVKATATAFASAEQSVTVNAYTLVKENTPQAVIDYRTEQLTGLTASAGYTVNGEAVTVDVDGKLAIDSSWLGTTLSIVKPGNGTTTENSAAQQLDVPARGTAPNTIGKTDETALHAANGTLTGLSTGMEYKKGSAGAWLDVGGSEVTGLAPDTYYVRVKATATAFASAEQSVTVNAYTLVKELTPVAGIDYGTEQLTGLTAGAGYTVNGEAVTVDGDGKLTIDSSWLGTTLSIVKPGNGTTTENSAAQLLDVPARAAAPVGVTVTDATYRDANNGALQNVTLNMEYRQGSEGAWLDVTGGSVTGLAPDTYYVRIKATETAFASAAQSVTVNAYTLVKELTPAAGIDYRAEQLTGLTAGAGYTVNREAVTPDGEGKLTIDSSWLGTMLSIVKQGNGTTTEDSAAQQLDVPARAAAPVGVTVTDATYRDANNGALQNVTLNMEYRQGSEGAWRIVEGTVITGLAPDIYEVRTKATETAFASNALQVRVHDSDAVIPSAPEVLADDQNNVILGLNTSMEFSVDGGPYTRYDGTNQPELNGEHTVEVRVAASGAVPAGPATTLVFTKNPVTPTNPETPTTPDDTPSNTDGNSTGTPPAVKADNEVIVLVNGKQENAGTANTVMNGNIQTMTIAVNPAKLQAKLDAEGRGAVVTIPVTADVNVIVSELNGQMVQNMERAAATIVLQTGKASYTLPAAEINIQNVAANFGAGVKLEDIKLKIAISETPADMQRVIALAAVKDGFTPVVPALDFRITGTYGNTTYEVSQFDVYVERIIPLHNDMDPSRITTGIVVEADGTVRHVPTKVILKDGTYYVVINSLTNSTYSVVWNPLTFADVEHHWAKEAVNDMGSRMVINGVSPAAFNPDAEITRAEFAAIMVRGLGLKLEKGQNTFTDVAAEAWYAGAVATAAKYGLITGFIDGSFRPDEAITREQAMHIITRAMKLTGLAEQIGAINAADVLGGFQDAGSIDDWAKDSLALAARAGLISGRSDHKLEAKSYVTRAEVAVLIQRLLQQSDLINK